MDYVQALNKKSCSVAAWVDYCGSFMNTKIVIQSTKKPLKNYYNKRKQQQKQQLKHQCPKMYLCLPNAIFAKVVSNKMVLLGVTPSVEFLFLLY